MICSKCKENIHFMNIKIHNKNYYCEKCYEEKSCTCVPRPTHNSTIDFMIEYLPGVKHIVYNNPATILIFKNGEKSIVKCQDDNEHDLEKAILFAYVKYTKKECKRFKAANNQPAKTGLEINYTIPHFWKNE